jgi:guanylate cyclase
MAIAGAPEPMEEWPAAVAAASAAVEMMEAAENLPMRLGLHTGGVVAGVIGSERMVWDVWGDTVNVASRMENSSVPGRIQVSADFAMLLANGAPPQLEGTDIMIHPPNFLLRMRGTIDVKGKGEMKTFWLERAAKP